MNSSVLKRQMLMNVRNGRYRTLEEFSAHYNSFIAEMEANKDVALIELRNTLQCQHQWKMATYYLDRAVVGYVYVFSRVCSSCSRNEVSRCKEEHERPAWAKDALKLY
jgi:hypothetical protein